MPPKTASNSLKECLLDSSLKIEEFPNQFKYPKIHLFLSELIEVFEIDDIQNYKIVQLCRNPYYKFTSLYFHNKRQIPKDHPLQKLSINQFANRIIDKLNDEDFINSFYFNKTEFIKSAIKNKKTWGGSRTLLQQSQWCDIPSVNIKYFKIENLQDGMDEVSDFIGTYLPDMNKKNENKEKVNYDDYLSEELKELIRLLNYDDFKILGYEG
jgi:hypothetical protein